LILASDNAVALDAVIATMMGLDAGQLRFLQKAKEAGLGDYELSTMELIGELKRLPDFKLPPLGGEAILENETRVAEIHSRTILRPQVDPEFCTSCGTCIDQCPVSALSMEDHLPQVDADTCITCFCCQEICPEKAMTLR
jgi:ferredoxin